MMTRSDRVARTLFTVSVLILAFGYGVAAHKYDLFPYTLSRDGIHTLETRLERPHFLFPVRYEEAGAKVYDRDEISPGVTLLTSYWPENGWSPGVRIINADGEMLHHWDINAAEIWPESPYSDTIAGTMNTPDNYVHGSHLFPNGDILINVEYLGLVRLDGCGGIVWKLPYRTHHSISRAEDGNFWVSAVKWVDIGSARAAEFPGLTPPYGEDMVLKVSPDGRILQEISVLKMLFDGGYQYLLWKYHSIAEDVTHINDVEELSTQMADNFPLFAAGDLVISLKHISSVLVFDPAGRIKWLDSHHFNRQHDADFESTGRVVVFDNREDGTDTGDYLGGSAISAINPASGEYQQIYPAGDSNGFFTNAGGKHQLLPNGNRLITEVRAGRVFEIDPSGRTVWEWIQQPYDARLVAEVMEGSRYAVSPGVVASWQCEETVK